MIGFNANHRSRLRDTFVHVDGLLSEVLRDLDAAQAESPFYRLIPDANPIQLKVMTDYAGRVRALMRSLLDHYEIPPSAPTVHATWAARVTLGAAQVSVLELRPPAMIGYGPLPAEAASELDSVVVQLLQLLGKMEVYLAQGTAQDLRARLERLPQGRPAVDLLRELERIVTAHGMVEFRSTLDGLLERLEFPELEIAVFGRVKTGKSSLLNYLLKTNVLPVGVTPVTAVPTRITCGAEPRGRVWFAEAPVQTVDIERLPEFATEQGNPANRKHVTRIQVEIPSPTLQQGITFVDTPGIGSLALSGTAESLAYLPRCDLGIVLVDAASALNQEDLSLVDLLHRAGAEVMLLLSKADILSAADRSAAASYIREQVQVMTSLDLPVHMVSILGSEARLCDRWFAEILLPAIKDQRHLAEQSLHRKLGGLRAAVAANLQRCLAVDKEVGRRPDQATAWNDVNRTLADALAGLDAARWGRVAIPEILNDLTETILAEIARLFVSHVCAGRNGLAKLEAVALDVLDRRSADLAAIVSRQVAAVREKLMTALQAATGDLGTPVIGTMDLPKPANLPVMVSRCAFLRPIELKTRFRWLEQGFLYRSLLAQLQRTERTAITNGLASYGDALETWRLGFLGELGKHYAAQCDLIQVQLFMDDGSGSRPIGDRETLLRDLEALRRFTDDPPQAATERSAHAG